MIFALTAAVLVSVVAHELGHAAAAQVLGLPWKPTLTRHGPGMVIGSDDIRLTRCQISLTAAAGPAANVVLAFVAIRLGMPLLALLNLQFAVVNLIPFPRSDGRRILRGYETDAADG